MRIFVKHIDMPWISICLLTILSGAYTTRLGASPIYPSVVAGIIICLAIIATTKPRPPLTLWTEFFATTLVIFMLGVRQYETESGASNIFNLLIGPLIYILAQVIGGNTPKQKLLNISMLHIGATLLLVAIECGHRLTHPDYGYLEDAAAVRGDVEDIAFYAYKFNSIMYLDSNFVGLQLAILFAFVCALHINYVKISLWVYFIIILLTALTISRASLFSIAAVALFIVFQKSSGTPRLIAIIISILATCVGIYSIQQDTSFLTKFDILQRFFYFLRNANAEDVLFGVGAGQASKALGIGAHNILVSYGTELGMIATTAIFLYWAWKSARIPGVSLLMVAWFVNGFSLTTLAIPYLYAAAALLRLLSLKNSHSNPHRT